MRRRKKLVLGGLGLLLGVPAALWTIGALLPAEHVARVEARMEARPAEVWARLVDPVASAAWRPSVSAVERLPDREGLPRFREHGAFGAIDYVHESRVEGRRLVTRIVDEPSFGGRWVYELEEDGTGCRLVITEEGVVADPLFRFLGRFVFGYDTTLRTFLDDLRSSLATGA